MSVIFEEDIPDSNEEGRRILVDAMTRARAKATELYAQTAPIPMPKSLEELENKLRLELEALDKDVSAPLQFPEEPPQKS